MQPPSSKAGFKKVNLGFAIVIAIALFNAVFSFYILQRNKAGISRITNIINPYVQLLEEFNLLVTESKMYATNWVYLMRSEEDKKQLVLLHKQRYPDLKLKITNHQELVDKKADEDTLSLVFLHVEELLGIESRIMNDLIKFDDYENPMKKFTAEETIETEVLPRTDGIMRILRKVISTNRQESEKMKNEMTSSFNRLIISVIALSLVLFFMIVMGAAFINKSITQPVLKMINMVMQMGRGELPEHNLKETQDVIGLMGTSVNRLSANFTKTTQFANEIEKGDLRAEFTPLSEQDKLGHALIAMRESLRAYSEEMENKVEERTREVVEKTVRLEKAYKEIRDSINYAKRIQDAMLNSHGKFDDVIDNSFIVFKPKDVVSGDFYWYYKTPNGLVIFSTIDCTGHGVPGAFMSMIGNSLLNEIVVAKGITSASNILNDLRQGIITALGQTGRQGEQKDGMDAALCVYNPHTKTIEFAGAFNPMWVIRGLKDGKSEMADSRIGLQENTAEFKRLIYHEPDGTAFELREFKPDRMPLAISDHLHKPFRSHWVQLNPGDTVYLFSDGYEDQFGGPMGKKFKVNRLRELVLNICSKSMPDQKDLLDRTIEEWKGYDEQTDDITVIGVRV